MPLKDSIAILAATTPPPPATRKEHNVGRANARISELEKALGAAHGPPTFNIIRANRRIEHLEGLLAQVKAGTLAPASVALAPAAAVTAQAAVARPVELTGDATLDKAIVASGCYSLRHYSAKAMRDKLFATAATLPPGSLARQCAESNLAKAQTELNDCN